MEFSYSEKVIQLQEELSSFMEEYVYPNEHVYQEQVDSQQNRWKQVPPIIEELTIKAKEKN